MVLTYFGIPPHFRNGVHLLSCMHGHTSYSKSSIDQPGKVANPARGQLNREMYYVFMYSHTYSKSMDQPGKVANPVRGQLKRENGYFLVPVRA